jgi:hypothetical protein
MSNVINGNAPAFSAYLSSSQSVSTGTWTKVTINTKEFDTNSNFDNVTNYRFTPTVAGYYQVTANSNWSSAVITSVCSIYKNGSEFKRGNQGGTASASSNGNSVSALIYFNGSTDYVEMYVLQYQGSSVSLSGGALYTYFQACLVLGQ